MLAQMTKNGARAFATKRPGEIASPRLVTGSARQKRAPKKTESQGQPVTPLARREAAPSPFLRERGGAPPQLARKPCGENQSYFAGSHAVTFCLGTSIIFCKWLRGGNEKKRGRIEKERQEGWMRNGVRARGAAARFVSAGSVMHDSRGNAF